MISPADVAAALALEAPHPDSSTYRQWTLWIANARLLLKTGDGTHAGLGDLDQLDQDVLDYVTSQAVVAQVQRPDDATSVEVAVDDGRVARTFSSSTGRVRIRDEWWAMLSPRSDSAAFSIGPSF